MSGPEPWRDAIAQAWDPPPDVAHPRVLVAGLGSVLMRDDGVGVHAARALKDALPAGAVPVEIGTAILEATPWLEWADGIVAVDALQAGGMPGTVYRIDDALRDVDERVGTSLHEIGLVETLRMMPENRRPRRVMVIGVEPGTIACGMDLSVAVSASLAGVMEAVREAARLILNNCRPRILRACDDDASLAGNHNKMRAWD